MKTELPDNIKQAVEPLGIIIEIEQLIDYFTDYKYVANMTEMQAKTLCSNVVSSLNRIKQHIEKE